MRFEWDDQKARANIKKHGVTFGEATPDEETVELVVTQEDYEAGLKRGWTDDDMLKPGRYKFRRGGFLKRHPELRVDDNELVSGDRKRA